MRHLILESNSDVNNVIRLFIPFGLLEDILTRGFPDPMSQSLEQNLIQDGQHVMGVSDEVRLTIDKKKVMGVRGTQTINSLLLVEISNRIVNTQDQIQKLEELVNTLKANFPNINFSVSSNWSNDLVQKEVPENLKGVFLEKDKWYLTEEAIKLIRDMEGRARLNPFWDHKHWAIGYGHMLTSQFQMGQSITQEKAEELFKQDLKRFEDGVKRTINVPLTLEMYGACVAFAYNAGNGGFRGSDVAKLINQKKYTEAAERWKTEKIALGTNVERGLRKRRDKESAFFMGNTQNNLA
jgi:lysozyme